MNTKSEAVSIISAVAKAAGTWDKEVIRAAVSMAAPIAIGYQAALDVFDLAYDAAKPESSAEIGARNRRLMFGAVSAADWDEAAWSRIVD